MFFNSALAPETHHETNAWWFIFRNDKLLIRKSPGGITIPRSPEVAAIRAKLLRIQFMGTFGETGCFVAEVDERMEDPQEMLFHELRPLLGLLSDEFFSVAGRAYQILYWDRTHQFCSRCGARLHHKKDERAKECPQCRLIDYPGTSPAVIVAIIKGREILLARARRFTAHYYSVLAGFVETGETLEDCVRREVKEEAGIDVESITYFGSQPWPFPNSLMIAFTAKHAGGEISIDATEIVEAQWFTADRIPEVPRKGTIARRLIDWFVGNQANDDNEAH